MSNKPSRWREFGGSRLVHRISAVVFLSILAIAAVLLVVSYFAEREHLLERLDVSAELVSPLIFDEDGEQTLRSLIKTASTESPYPLVGATLQRRDGSTVVIGQASRLMSRGQAGIADDYLDTDHATYTRHLRSDNPGSLYASAWLRFDVDRINSELQAYVWRIIGLVITVCLFVTVSCVFGLRSLLILPLLKLQQIMANTEQQGLTNISLASRYLDRKDELGDLFRMFDHMRLVLARGSEQQVQLSERFQDFADLGAECFFEFDANGRLAFVSGYTNSLLGTRPADLLGRSVRVLMSGETLPFRDPVEVVRSISETGSWEGRLRATGDRTETRSIRIVAKFLYDGQRRTGVRGIITDVTMASNLARELKHQATHDPLTGLVNRAEFERRLNKALAASTERNETATLLMLDLDRFKVVNDTCGHIAGDELLKQLSALIHRYVRGGDVVARIGGDEFAVLLKRCGLDEAAQVAEKIRCAIEDFRFRWHGESYSVGVSIGAAALDEQFADGQEAMRAVDGCCYKSKQAGRNRVTLFKPGDELVSSQHGEMMWLAQINQGLEEDRFEIYQQPIVPVRSDPKAGRHFEVLLRLRSRDGEMLSPGDFLPAAERYGLMGKIDRWVVRVMVPWVAQQVAAGEKNLTVCINLSGGSASDPEFQDFLVTTLGHNFDAVPALCFEITESAAVKNLAGTADFLLLLREMGCQIALDDFGTGFASMDYIKQLPLDYIKIDGGFIRHIASSPLDRTLVQCVAAVARVLNVKTVGEFVENDEILATMREVGIDYAQGYLTGRPEPLEMTMDRPAESDTVDEHVHEVGSLG